MVFSLYIWGNIGNTAALAELNIQSGTGELKGGTVNVNVINLLNDEVPVGAPYESAVIFSNPVTVTGAIDNNLVTATGDIIPSNPLNGVVTFKGAGGDSSITGNIGGTDLGGGNKSSIKTLNANVDYENNLVFGKDVYAQTVNFDDASIGGDYVGSVKVGGDLIATNVNFGGNAQGGTLEFNGAGDAYDFKGAITNGGNATLNVNTKALTVYDPSIGSVKVINIGRDKSLEIDLLSGGNVDILGSGKRINFMHPTAKLVLRNSSELADASITLGATLNPDVDNTGIVTLDSVKAGRTLKIGGAGFALGGSNRLSSIVFSGEGDFDTTEITLNTRNIELDVAAIKLGAVNANITLLKDTVLTQSGDINGFLDFNGKDGTVKLMSGVNISGPVQNTGGSNSGPILLNTGGNSGTILLQGGYIGGSVNGLKLLQVGTGGGELKTGGNTLITEIQGTTANSLDTLILPANIILTTDINKTGGLPFTLNFTNGGSVSGTMGTKAYRIAGLSARGTTSFKGSVFSSGPIYLSGATTFENSVNNIGAVTTNGTTNFNAAFTNEGNLTLAGSTNFGSTFMNTGTAAIGGMTNFADTFTNTGEVTLAQDSITNFAGDVTATNFTSDGATMNFVNSLAFNGDITGSGTTITLGPNRQVYTGEGSFTDTLTLSTTFDVAEKTGGNILITSGSTLDLSKLSNLALVITLPNVNINNIDQNSRYKIISAEVAGGFNPPLAADVDLTLNGQQNRFVKFTLDKSSLTLFVTDAAKDRIEEDFGPGGPLENIPNAQNIKTALKLMEAALNGSNAREAFNNFGLMTPLQQADAADLLMQDEIRPSYVTSVVDTQAILDNVSSNLTTINARMDRIQTANQTTSQSANAVSAGDEEENAKFSVWIGPFIGNARQKMHHNNISGYKSNTRGGTIGFDSLVTDDLVLGAAYTKADSDIKLKNNKLGDKDEVHSNIYSLYGLYNLPDNNFFLEGIASYADSKITKKSRRIVALRQNTINYGTAIGKYKSRNYTAQLIAGYAYVMSENMNLTPIGGLKISNIKDKGYKETGTIFQNLIVKGKSYDSFDAMLGARLSSDINTGNLVLTPELYVAIGYAFKNKVPAIDARLQGMTQAFPSDSFKPSKTSFDIGIGVTAKYKMVEYGINYNTNIASKYFAQQSSLKVRVKL